MNEPSREPAPTPRQEEEIEDSWRPEDKAARAARENPRGFGPGAPAVESTGDQ